MTHYFFNLIDDGVDLDRDGSDLPGLREARSQAVQYLAGSLRDHPDLIWGAKGLRVEVVDEVGHRLFMLVAKAVT